MNERIIKILEWTAIGDCMIDITDVDGDKYGEYCPFDNCIYNTDRKINKHSEDCLIIIARKELARMGRSLRKYIISFTRVETPTKKLFLQTRSIKEKKLEIHREIYTTELLKFDVDTFIQKEIQIGQSRYLQGAYDITIDHKTIAISEPEFLEE